MRDEPCRRRRRPRLDRPACRDHRARHDPDPGLGLVLLSAGGARAGRSRATPAGRCPGSSAGLRSACSRPAGLAAGRARDRAARRAPGPGGERHAVRRRAVRPGAAPGALPVYLRGLAGPRARHGRRPLRRRVRHPGPALRPGGAAGDHRADLVRRLRQHGCWPLSACSPTSLGWRGACLAYAALHLVVALPLYLFALPKAGMQADGAAETPGAAGRRPPQRGPSRRSSSCSRRPSPSARPSRR